MKNKNMKGKIILVSTDKPVTDSYTACSIVEGFDGEQHTQTEELEAWSYLIKTGQCWSLQGWYGRTANALIEGGFISKDGTILKTS